MFGHGTSIQHEEIFLERDHLVRVRQMDCSCTVINLHYQPEGTFQELRQRLRAALARWPTLMVWVSSFVTSIFVILLKDRSILTARPSVMATPIALPLSSPPSPAPWKLHDLTSHGRTKGVMAPSTHYPASTACSSIFRWLSFATSAIIPIPLGPSVTNPNQVTISLFGSHLSASAQSSRTTLSCGDGLRNILC